VNLSWNSTDLPWKAGGGEDTVDNLLANDVISLSVCGNPALVDVPAGGLSAEASQFIARIDDPGSARTTLYAALIDDLASAGVWAEIQALYIFAAASAGTALTNLKSASFPASANGAMTFTADVGYTGEATTTKHIKTGYTPATHGLQNDQHAMVWNNTDVQSVFAAMGCQVVATDNQISVYPDYTDTSKQYFRVNSDLGHDGIAVGDPRGMLLGSRDASDHSDFYFNGSQVGPTTADSGSPANLEVYICAINKDGTAEGSGWQIRAASLGTALTSTQAAAFYTHLNTFLTAVDA
jgi:hypothetical protein